MTSCKNIENAGLTKTRFKVLIDIDVDQNRMLAVDFLNSDNRPENCGWMAQLATIIEKG